MSNLATDRSAVVDVTVPGEDGLRVNEADIVRLAAVRAALDPARQQMRADIIVTSVTEALSRGALSTEELLVEVNKAWATHALTRPTLERALQLATAARLVMQQQAPGEESRWVVGEATLEDVSRDREHAINVFNAFATDLGRRLLHLGDLALEAEQLHLISHKLFCSLAEAVEGLYRARVSLHDLRGFNVDGRAVLASARKRRIYEVVSTDARSVLSEVLPEVIAAILDPADPLGNELLRLLVVGNLLQGLAAGRDLGVQALADHTRVALDTSVLVNAVAADPVAKQVFEELVGRCRALGVNVVVLTHTLEEYENLFDSGGQELSGLSEADLERLGTAGALLQNPFSRDYLRCRSASRKLTWDRYRVGRRDIAPYLVSQGVTLEDGPLPTDNEVVRVRGTLDELAENPYLTYS